MQNETASNYSVYLPNTLVTLAKDHARKTEGKSFSRWCQGLIENALQEAGIVPRAGRQRPWIAMGLHLEGEHLKPEDAFLEYAEKHGVEINQEAEVA